jgi:hypothetical protein
MIADLDVQLGRESRVGRLSPRLDKATLDRDPSDLGGRHVTSGLLEDGDRSFQKGHYLPHDQLRLLERHDNALARH